MTVETDLALLKQDVVSIFELFTKLDLAITKFGDVSNNIGKLLAVHEEKINTHERQTNALEQDIKEINSRISETTRDIAEDLGEIEKRITQCIKDLKVDVAKEREEHKKGVESLEKRIEILERWRWIVMGGASSLGFLLAKLVPVFEVAAK